MPPHPTQEDALLRKAAELLEAHLDNEPFGVSELAREMGMSRSNLHRKIKSVSGKPVSQFIREFRLNKAMELLKDSDLTVSEVAYRVGFGSATYFTKCFHDHYGYPPGDAGKRANVPDPSSLAQPKLPRKIPWGNIPVPWLIIAGMAIIAAAVIIITSLPFSQKDPSGNPTILILPFRNDSPGNENAYIINGLMEELLNKLTLLEDLNVVSRTTSEIYRNSHKSLKVIGEELGADFILEGSATILKKNTRIRLQLIEPVTDRHLWSRPYDREITLENIFEVQEELALAVADELVVILKPEEREMIERKPTENLEAYVAYLKAIEIINITGLTFDNWWLNSDRVITFLEKAIELDPGFADAYAMIGMVYIQRLSGYDMISRVEISYAYLDTGMVYVEKALSLDKDHPYASYLKAMYYQKKGAQSEAELWYQKASSNKPVTYNDFAEAVTWSILSDDFVRAVDNYLKYNQLTPPGVITPLYLHEHMYKAFGGTGFRELARKHINQRMDLIHDSLLYYLDMSELEEWSGNYEEALKYRLEILDQRFSWRWHWLENMNRSVLLLVDFDQKDLFWARWREYQEQKQEETPTLLDAYYYLKTRQKERADYHLQGLISCLNKNLNYPIPEVYMGNVQLKLALAYSMMDNQPKTLEHLQNLKHEKTVGIGIINTLKQYPTLDFVRETTEFREIFRFLESKYLKEHKRIEKLLRKEGMVAE